MYFFVVVDIHTLCRAPYMGGATPSILQSSRAPVTQEIQKPRSESWLDLNFIFFSGGFIYKYVGSSIVAGFNTQKLLHHVLCKVHSSVTFSGKHSTVKDLFFFEEWIGTKCIPFMWCFVCISRPYSLGSRLIINSTD